MPGCSPGPGGWAPDGSNWGQAYLDNFYKTMQKHPDKIAVGGAWPGFDDSAAKWGLNRHIQSACGKTLDETLNFYERYYDSSRPLAVSFDRDLERLRGGNCH